MIKVQIDPRDSLKSLLNSIKIKYGELYSTVLDEEFANKLLIIVKCKTYDETLKKEVLKSFVINGDQFGRSLNCLDIVHNS